MTWWQRLFGVGLKPDRDVVRFLSAKVLTQTERDDESLLMFADWEAAGKIGDRSIQADQLMRLRNAGLVTLKVEVTEAGRRRARELVS